MNKVLNIIIEGLIVYTLIWLFNYIIFVKDNKKKKKLKAKDMPLELIYLSSIYEIDSYKINFHKFQIAYCFINSFIITTTYLLVVYLLDSMPLRIIFGIAIVILLIIICYGLLGRYYLYKQGKEVQK